MWTKLKGRERKLENIAKTRMGEAYSAGEPKKCVEMFIQKI